MAYANCLEGETIDLKTLWMRLANDDERRAPTLGEQKLLSAACVAIGSGIGSDELDDGLADDLLNLEKQNLERHATFFHS